MKNIILIGMPGSGKSTVGVVLAKAANMAFTDADLVIQRQCGRLLQDIIDADGIEAFLEKEEAALCSLTDENTVIATGGSAVYSEKAMQRLKENGIAVFLDVPVEELERRIDNMKTRGIILSGSFAETYAERIPLYKKYADVTINCSGLGLEETVAEITAATQNL